MDPTTAPAPTGFSARPPQAVQPLDLWVGESTGLHRILSLEPDVLQAAQSPMGAMGRAAEKAGFTLDVPHWETREISRGSLIVGTCTAHGAQGEDILLYTSLTVRTQPKKVEVSIRSEVTRVGGAPARALWRASAQVLSAEYGQAQRSQLCFVRQGIGQLLRAGGLFTPSIVFPEEQARLLFEALVA